MTKTFFFCAGALLVSCKASPTPYTFTDGGPSTPATKGQTVAHDFEHAAENTGTPPELAHVLGEWTVEPHGGNKLLKQKGAFEEPDFPRVLLKGVSFRNVHVKVRCAMEGGDVDRACGIMWRAKDSDNYYLARANALEDNVNLYKVVNADRQSIASHGVRVQAWDWHVLEAFMEGAHVRVLFDGAEVLSADDTTFAEGKVGLWTKADSVTVFDDLEVTEL